MNVRHKVCARQLVGYLPKFNKARWPKGVPHTAKQELKRLIYIQICTDVLSKMLETVNVLSLAGVKMGLPSRGGVWATMTSVLISAYLSVGNKGAKALTHMKDAHCAMPAFCVQYGLPERKYCSGTNILFRNRKLFRNSIPFMSVPEWFYCSGTV